MNKGTQLYYWVDRTEYETSIHRKYHLWPIYFLIIMHLQTDVNLRNSVIPLQLNLIGPPLVFDSRSVDTRTDCSKWGHSIDSVVFLLIIQFYILPLIVFKRKTHQISHAWHFKIKIAPNAIETLHILRNHFEVMYSYTGCKVKIETTNAKLNKHHFMNTLKWTKRFIIYFKVICFQNK